MLGALFLSGTGRWPRRGRRGPGYRLGVRFELRGGTPPSASLPPPRAGEDLYLVRADAERHVSETLPPVPESGLVVWLEVGG